MKKILMMAALIVLTLSMAVTSCSKDDDVEETTVSKIDPALTGTWVLKSGPTEISEAASFKQNGEVLFYVSAISQFGGGWYHGNYSLLDNGRILAHVCRITMVDFRSFNDYSAMTIDPVYYDWYFSYSISDNTLKLEQDGYYRNLTLERLVE